MARQRRHFTREHKDEIVRVVLDGPRPIAHVAREVEIHDATLGNWVKVASQEARRGLVRHDVGRRAEEPSGTGTRTRGPQASRRERVLEKAAALFAKDYR